MFSLSLWVLLFASKYYIVYKKNASAYGLVINIFFFFWTFKHNWLLLTDSWLGTGGRQREQAVADAEAEHDEGSGSGDGDNYGSGSSGHLPIDDEDAYTPKNKEDHYSGYDDDEEIYPPHSHGSGHDAERAYEHEAYEGSGWDMEGSGGGDFIHRSHVPENTHGNTRTVTPRQPQTTPRNTVPKQDSEQPPSAAAKESMSLNRAITIYMLPAFIMFLGSLA